MVQQLLECTSSQTLEAETLQRLGRRGHPKRGLDDDDEMALTAHQHGVRFMDGCFEVFVWWLVMLQREPLWMKDSKTTKGAEGKCVKQHSHVEIGKMKAKR